MKTRQIEEKKHEIKVGLMILLGIIIIIFVIFAVSRQQGILEERYELVVFMSRVNGLQTGAPVRLNGVRVGSVTGISFSKNPEDQKIKVTLEILSSVKDRIRKDSEAYIGTLGLLGDKFVSISSGSFDQPMLKNGDQIEGTDPIDVEKLIDESVGTLDEIKQTGKTLKEISEKINNSEGTVGLLVNDPELYYSMLKLSNFVDNLKNEIESSDGSIAKILRDSTLYDELRMFLENTNALTDSLINGKGSAAKLVKKPAIYDQLVQGLENINEITEKIKTGEGTLGQAVNNEQLYNDLKKVTTDLDSLVNDIRQNPKKYVTVKIF